MRDGIKENENIKLMISKNSRKNIKSLNKFSIESLLNSSNERIF